MKISPLKIMLMILCVMHASNTAQAQLVAEQAATFDHQLPHLHAALLAHGHTSDGLIEYLDHLVQKHHGPYTWELKEDTRVYTKNLLEILNTIAAEQPATTQSTILLQGNPGMLPIALLAAGLCRIGKNDVSIQIISKLPLQSRRHMHQIIRRFLGKNDRCFVQQFTTTDAFAAACRRYLRKPNIIISFAGQPTDLGGVLDQPLTFDYIAGVVQ